MDMFGAGHNYLMDYVLRMYGSQIDEIKEVAAKEAFIKAKTQESLNSIYKLDVDWKFMDDVYGYKGLWSAVDFTNYTPIIEHFDIPNDERQAILNCLDQVTKYPFNSTLNGNSAIAQIIEHENRLLSQPKGEEKINALIFFPSPVTAYTSNS